jgi:hypothetical protein
MVTTKDLVEAHVFNRRRLLAAFTRGGCEIGTGHRGRAIIAGLLLAVVLLAVVAAPLAGIRLPIG